MLLLPRRRAKGGFYFDAISPRRDFFVFIWLFLIIVFSNTTKVGRRFDMGDKNVGMIVVFVIAIIIGFISMVTSAMAASDVRTAQDKGAITDAKNDNDLNEAHKTATVSAVLQGVTLGLILVGLIIYLLYKKGGDIQEGLKGAHGALSEQAAAAQQWYGR